MVSGTVHIYVESGVKGYTKEYGDDAVIGTKMSSARYDGEMSILTKFTGTLTEDLNSYFTVNGPDGSTVAVKEVKTVSDTEYHLDKPDARRAGRHGHGSHHFAVLLRECVAVAGVAAYFPEHLNSYFTVNGPDGSTVAVKEVKTVSDTEYQLVLEAELDAGKSYTVTCDGTTYKVVMPIIFSTAKFEEKYTGPYRCPSPPGWSMPDQ